MNNKNQSWKHIHLAKIAVRTEIILIAYFRSLSFHENQQFFFTLIDVFLETLLLSTYKYVFLKISQNCKQNICQIASYKLTWWKKNTLLFHLFVTHKVKIKIQTKQSENFFFVEARENCHGFSEIITKSHSITFSKNLFLKIFWHIYSRYLWLIFY